MKLILVFLVIFLWAGAASADPHFQQKCLSESVFELDQGICYCKANHRLVNPSDSEDLLNCSKNEKVKELCVDDSLRDFKLEFTGDRCFCPYSRKYLSPNQIEIRNTPYASLPVLNQREFQIELSQFLSHSGNSSREEILEGTAYAHFEQIVSEVQSGAFLFPFIKAFIQARSDRHSSLSKTVPEIAEIFSLPTPTDAFELRRAYLEEML